MVIGRGFVSVVGSMLQSYRLDTRCELTAGSLANQQFDDFEGGYREHHDDQQEYQRALSFERFAARLFDSSQNPVGAEVERDRGDSVVEVLHRSPRLSGGWVQVKAEQVNHYSGN